MIACIEQFQNCGHSSQAGREREASSSSLEVRHAALVGEPGWVLRPRVLKPLVNAWTLLNVSGCRIDWRHDGACRRIRCLAGVDGARSESMRHEIVGEA